PRCCALDHDSVAGESEVLERVAKRLRSSRSRALDHDSIGLREQRAAGPRSTGSDGFPDHVPTARPLVPSVPTVQCWPEFAYSSMQFRSKIARKFFFVQLHCMYKKTTGRKRVHENPQAAWLSRSVSLRPTHRRAVGTSFLAAERQDDGVHARLVAIGPATTLLALPSS